MTHQRGSTTEENTTAGTTDSTTGGAPPTTLPDVEAPEPIAEPKVTGRIVGAYEDEVPPSPPDPSVRLLPVLAYDVMTTGTETLAPRLIVSVRESPEAHALAGHLNAMEASGLLITHERYTVALPREVGRIVPTTAPVIAGGYELSPDAFIPPLEPVDGAPAHPIELP